MDYNIYMKPGLLLLRQTRLKTAYIAEQTGIVFLFLFRRGMVFFFGVRERK